MRRLVTIFPLVAAASAFLASRPARACRVLEVQFSPSAKLQIVIWIERADGICMNAGPSGTDCVETVFVTRMTGYYGIGNRPGMMDFNSGYHFPYGRRTSVL